MVKQAPHWQSRFLERNALPPGYLVNAQKWFTPVLEAIRAHHDGASRPLLLAINGSQGSGKTTLCDYLCSRLSAELGLPAVAMSLDDFYLTRQQRQALAVDVHPLLATRGVPGTHDLPLLQATLAALRAGEPAAIPRFDKANDDRAPRESWQQLATPVAVILLEGWCLGARSQPTAALAVPVNTLEVEEDADGRWRQYVNRVLEEAFPALYALVDQSLMLQAPSFDAVYGWRLEQEQKLARRRSGAALMSPGEIARFVQFFQRLTEHCLASLPGRVNHLYQLDGDRRIASYTNQPEARL